ncbi:MAG: SagB family peptide dehydrogenase [Actinomycetota bacterium]
MNVRRSAHVVLTWHPSRSSGDATAFALLTGERVPLTRARVADLLEIPENEFVARDEEWIDELCRTGVLVSDASDRRSTELRRRDEAIPELGWDFESAYFHLAKRLEGFHGSLAPPAERTTEALHDLPNSLGAVELPLSDRDSDFYRLLLRRRTQRGFHAQGELALEQLSVLLRYVWGAHAYGRDGRGAPLLAKTSPSGGSLHPIEVYPLLSGVLGIDPGLYHYSVRAHALELMERIEPAAVHELADHFMAGQPWFAEAQAFFLLTARFERSYSKYREDAGAYQSLLLEAGHFSQTFYLVSTELRLGPFVTSVINHADIDNRLGLDPYREGALAICGCGLPADSSPIVHDKPFVPRETKLRPDRASSG